jgi:hypothetical protein
MADSVKTGNFNTSVAICLRIGIDTEVSWRTVSKLS